MTILEILSLFLGAVGGAFAIIGGVLLLVLFVRYVFNSWG